MSSEENRPKLVCIPEVIFFNQEYPILIFPKLNAHLREKKRRDTGVYKCTFISHMSVFIYTNIMVSSPRDSKLQDAKGFRNF